MAYLSIINGVKGLWFYTGSGERDVQKKPAGLLNQPEASHWDYVQKLVRELRLFSPIIMAPLSSHKVEMVPPNVPVEFTTRQLDGKLYIIAANKSPQAQSVHFTANGIKGRKVQVLYETQPASIQGDSMADEFGPLAVHVYQIE